MKEAMELQQLLQNSVLPEIPFYITAKVDISNGNPQNGGGGGGVGETN